MKKPYLPFLVMYISLHCFITRSAYSQTEITIRDSDINGNNQTYTWSPPNTYLLDGLVYVESGATLNIAPGTVIRAKENPSSGDPTSALIISRGAKINAIGSRELPIIFTSEYDDLSTTEDLTAIDNGFWGGIIILGNAPIARPGSEDQVEGINSDELRARYGGNDENDNSGKLNYVSIRHSGSSLAPGNEINALTLGGVGRQTQLDHVELFANQDDGIEIFGGTVEIKHILSAYNGDDALDFDFGWRGKGQFICLLLGTTIGNLGIEGDGAKPDLEPNFSLPTLSNITMVGTGLGSSSNSNLAIMLRDKAGGRFYNNIFTDFRFRAIQIEDLPSQEGEDSYSNFLNGDIEFKNNYFWDFGVGNNWNELLFQFPDGNDPSGNNIANYLRDNNYYADPQIRNITRSPDEALDLRLSDNSPLQNAAIPVNDPFFEAVSFVGAFGSQYNWANRWTALSTYNYLNPNVSTNQVEEKILRKLYPNPIQQNINIESKVLRQGETILIQWIDGMGREICSTSQAVITEGLLKVNTPNIPSGSYFLKISNKSGFLWTERVIK